MPHPSCLGERMEGGASSAVLNWHCLQCWTLNYSWICLLSHTWNPCIIGIHVSHSFLNADKAMTAFLVKHIKTPARDVETWSCSGVRVWTQHLKISFQKLDLTWRCADCVISAQYPLSSLACLLFSLSLSELDAARHTHGARDDITAPHLTAAVFLKLTWAYSVPVRILQQRSYCKDFFFFFSFS